MTFKYLENLHRDSPLFQYSIAKTLFAPGSPHDSKMPFEQLFLDDPISTALNTNHGHSFNRILCFDIQIIAYTTTFLQLAFSYFYVFILLVGWLVDLSISQLVMHLLIFFQHFLGSFCLSTQLSIRPRSWLFSFDHKI